MSKVIWHYSMLMGNGTVGNMTQQCMGGIVA